MCSTFEKCELVQAVTFTWFVRIKTIWLSCFLINWNFAYKEVIKNSHIAQFEKSNNYCCAGKRLSRSVSNTRAGRVTEDAVGRQLEPLVEVQRETQALVQTVQQQLVVLQRHLEQDARQQSSLGVQHWLILGLALLANTLLTWALRWQIPLMGLTVTDPSCGPYGGRSLTLALQWQFPELGHTVTDPTHGPYCDRSLRWALQWQIRHMGLTVTDPLTGPCNNLSYCDRQHAMVEHARSVCAKLV